MTERLYYTDATLLDFGATVVSVADDGRRVFLDRTAFYPTSGGQPHDTGVLAGVPVIDVVDEGDRIAHVLAAPFSGSGTITARVDAARRREHMQQHTGQHLLSAVLADVAGAATVSVHFGIHVSTIEVDLEALEPEVMRRVEAQANAIVMEARPVTVSFEEEGAAALRKPSSRTGPLRIVTIADTDRSACGGTHVASTAAIGPIFLRGAERIRKRTRLHFTCGDRALAAARSDFEIVTDVARALSAAPSDVASLVRANAARVRALEGEAREMRDAVAHLHVRDVYDRTAAGTDGIRVVIERLEPGSADRLRANAAVAATLARVVYIGTVASGGLVAYATSADTGIDAGVTLRRALGAVGGRGGGSARIAQGSVRDAAGVEDVVTQLRIGG